MDQLIDSYKNSKNLHHAYFLIGDAEETFLKLKNFLEEEVKIKTSGSADFWCGQFNTLNIEGARDITESQERKNFNRDLSGQAGRKIFIIQADFITEEAQNSLLKVFEEPTIGTHFFIISPQDILLPTLRSRVQVIFHNSSVEDEKSILNLKLVERLDLVKGIIEGISEAKSSSNSIARSAENGFREEKTKQDAIALLNQLETELYKRGVEKNSRALKLCEESRLSLYDRGAPVKIILENLMLNV